MPVTFPNADDAIGAVFQGGPVALAYSRFDHADREGAHAEYLASIASYRHGDAYHVLGEFVAVSGVK